MDNNGYILLRNVHILYAYTFLILMSKNIVGQNDFWSKWQTMQFKLDLEKKVKTKTNKKLGK